MLGTDDIQRLAAFLSVLLLAACGDGDLHVYEAVGDPDDPSSELDAGMDQVEDAGDDQSTPDPDPDPDPGPDADDNPVVDPDMGSDGLPDVPHLDMEMPMPPPTTNAPQSGPTVEQQITSQCSTIAVKGLSLQLIDQMNCEDPGVMKSFEGAPGINYGSVVFPFQQGPATDTLMAVAANNAGTMSINSALRTVPQQYLLYEWYRRGLCNANLAATPGRSNHNGGLAVDISDSSTWRTAMRNQSYIDNVSGEPWHFYYSGAGGQDVRNLSVLAFQKLYNLNFPENPIDEDGLYGPQTEGALQQSPANGFTRDPSCTSVDAMTAYPHRAPLDVSWEHLGDRLIGIHTIAPPGILLVEYYVDGELVGFADRDGQQFETVIELPRKRSDSFDLEVVAYDQSGDERAASRGIVDGTKGGEFFIRPLGGVNYEIGFAELPNGVRSVDFFVDGILVDQDPLLKIGAGPDHRVAVQLPDGAELDVVSFDARYQVVEMRSVVFAR